MNTCQFTKCIQSEGSEKSCKKDTCLNVTTQTYAQVNLSMKMETQGLHLWTGLFGNSGALPGVSEHVQRACDLVVTSGSEFGLQLNCPTYSYHPSSHFPLISALCGPRCGFQLPLHDFPSPEHLLRHCGGS